MHIVPRCSSERIFPSRTFRALNPRGRQQYVTSADGDLNEVTGGGVSERRFDFACALAEPDAHHAIRLAKVQNRGAQQVFKSRSLRQPFSPRRVENVHRRAMAHDAAVIDGNDALAESVYFLTAVGDIENRNAFCGVPGAQVFDDGGFQFGVQAC